MTQTEALKLALEALENWLEFDPETFGEVDKKAITAIKSALEAKDEPVQNQLMALIDENQRLRAELKFNTTPPQRKPLTDEEIERIYNRYGGEMINCARAIERAHGIKGEA